MTKKQLQKQKASALVFIVSYILLVVFMMSPLTSNAATLPSVQNASVTTLIERYGYGEGLSDYEVSKLKSIAWCESTYQPWVSNGQYRGLFQMGYTEFATYGDGDIFNAQDNIRSAIRLYQSRGFQPWSCK